MEKVNNICLFCFMIPSFSEKQRKKILEPCIKLLGYYGISAQVSDFRKDGYLNISLEEGNEFSHNDAQFINAELEENYTVVEFHYVTKENPTPGTFPHLLIRFKPKEKEE